MYGTPRPRFHETIFLPTFKEDSIQGCNSIRKKPLSEQNQFERPYKQIDERSKSLKWVLVSINLLKSRVRILSPHMYR